MEHMLAVLLAQPRHPSKSMLLVRHFGGLALLPLGILDSSIVPTFGSLDLLTAWLAAATPSLWFYYAGMSTAGSLLGALITYRMGKRAGGDWIARKIGERRLNKLGAALEHWRFGAIFVSTIAPPPFPTSWFFLVAGAFSFPRSQLITAVLLGRSLRYSLVTLVAAHYGRHFLRYLRHPMHYLLVSLIITASLLAATWLFARRRNGWQTGEQARPQNV
jgi:membrane protein YqaA with SNARE-associated domain